MATLLSLKIHKQTIEFVKDELPNLNSNHVEWDSASLPSEDYNCMGMAVGVLRWWQPPDAPGLVTNPRDYWPKSVEGDSLHVDAFVEAAKTCGFIPCENPDWDPLFEKIVLFHKLGEFTHAAVQISPDLWKSKFGNLSNFTYSLHEISGCNEYGDGRRYMKRARPGRPV